ncbi:MAG: hypothetical protein M1826_004341, partial [Phylliscum demangeonii]
MTDAERAPLLLRRPPPPPFGERAPRAIHPGPCHHGTFSPQPTSADRFWGRSSPVPGARLARPLLPSRTPTTTALLRPRRARPLSRFLTFRYLAYYIPCLSWLPSYQWRWVRGDLAAALTMASFYLPMSLSYAASLGHIPAVNGLYGFVFAPAVYAALGTSARMVVGPEAAGSLLLGSIVRSAVDAGQFSDEDDVDHARVAGVITALAGAIVLGAGLARLGFLDNVLSRPFLRGFISAIGGVILVDQLLLELGLDRVAQADDGGHRSTVGKVAFLLRHVREAHRLTAAVAGVAFVVIMLCRQIKHRLQPRYPTIAYLPDRFLVVALSALLTWHFRWDQQGLQIVGDVRPAAGRSFTFHWPFQASHMQFIRQAMSTSFLIGMLGFFESSVAAKSLASLAAEPAAADSPPGVTLSANRELVALGVANLLGGCFMSLPAFGGYGRSKINAAAGGRTGASSLFLSAISAVCVLYLLPYFYYLPKAVLAAMISVVAWSLMEEAPADIAFFYRLRGWSELGLMTVIFAATVLYSLTLGIAIGVGLSVTMVLRHSTRSRIQILGRVPGTRHAFENVEAEPDPDPDPDPDADPPAPRLELIDRCLIVKIPEPLTFANTGDLRTRLRRLERQGSTLAHPAGAAATAAATTTTTSFTSFTNIIFDVHGVTTIDGSGAQELAAIVAGYRARAVRVFFCRIFMPPWPGRRTMLDTFRLAGIVDACGGGVKCFVPSVEDALEMVAREEAEAEAEPEPEPEAEVDGREEG